MTIAVLYRWRVKPGMEAQFRQAWTEGTRAIHARCPSYGARLHRTGENLFVSYALWPDDQARRRCFADHDFSDDGMDSMQEAVAERLETEVMTVEADLLRALPDEKP